MRKSAIVILVISLICSGCGTTLSKYEKNISERREYLFTAASASGKVTAIAGVREDPYVMDGHSGNHVPFTVVTVTPTRYEAGKTVRYRASVGEETFEGELLPHPFAPSLSVDLPVTATSPFSFTVIGEKEETFDLQCETGNVISADKAFTVAVNRLDKSLKRFKERGKLKAEIYIRLMENSTTGDGGYFWYVAFVGESGDTVAVLLHADTGELAAVRA